MNKLTQPGVGDASRDDPGPANAELSLQVQTVYPVDLLGPVEHVVLDRPLPTAHVGQSVGLLDAGAFEDVPRQAQPW